MRPSLLSTCEDEDGIPGRVLAWERVARDSATGATLWLGQMDRGAVLHTSRPGAMRFRSGRVRQRCGWAVSLAEQGADGVSIFVGAPMSRSNLTAREKIADPAQLVVFEVDGLKSVIVFPCSEMTCVSQDGAPLALVRRIVGSIRPRFWS